MHNLIFNRDEYSVIVLTNGEEVLVDTKDVEFLSSYKWTKSKLGYAVANKNRDSHFMHRVIMKLNKGDGIFVDHINRDGLDNRSQNLRLCTRKQNQQNRPPNHTNASRYKGVGYFKRDRKWRARINTEDKQLELGKFTCETCAALAYDEAAKKYHKEFAWLNGDHFELKCAHA